MVAFTLWKHHTIDKLKKEFYSVLENDKSAVFIKYILDKPAGFAFCSLRNDYVEGYSTSPVVYLESLYQILCKFLNSIFYLKYI